MTFQELENFMNENLTIDEDSQMFEDHFSLSLCQDGCLHAKFNGINLLTEGMPWEDSVKFLCDYIVNEKKYGKPIYK